jgi:hypothetical protein
MREELLKGLSKQQIEKASKCKNGKELLALAREEGVELTEEQLKSVNGGACVDAEGKKITKACPQCNAAATGTYVETTPGDGKYHFACLACGYEWFEK